MNIIQVEESLKSLGWSVHVDEVGDKFAQFTLSDRILDIIYKLDKIRDQQKFGAMLSLSTDKFSNSCAEICGEKPKYYPLVRAWKRLDFRAPQITEEHIREAAHEAIDWAQEQDLGKALLDHAALPTDAPGARPIWHLAALALLGDVAKLESYQSSFKEGDRLGFVPYISEDYISRAVAIARQKEVV